MNDFEEAGKTILKEISGRMRDVIERRFGIGSRLKRQTLESIGQTYKITRERVRQIEAAALNKLRSSASFAAAEPLLKILEKEFNLREKIWREDQALSHLATNPAGKNYVQFFLSLGKIFLRLGADADFYHRWVNDLDAAQKAESVLKSFCKSLGDDPLDEKEITARFQKHAENSLGKKITNEAIFSWLGVSKNINKNIFGEWGLSSSPLVKPSGMRDFAYLVLKKHGSPLHFREVASAIERAADRRAHIQTVHNELIKDDRFVLVGRGLYALSGWGYEPGTVKDIISSVLSKRGPLRKEELIKSVKEERHVKDNTILINLQNRSLFQKLPDGRFHLA